MLVTFFFIVDQEEELEITNPAYVSRISPSTERRRIANARTSAFESKLFTLSSQLIKKKTRSHVIPISLLPTPTPTTTVSLGTCALRLFSGMLRNAPAQLWGALRNILKLLGSGHSSLPLVLTVVARYLCKTKPIKIKQNNNLTAV